MKKYLNKGLLYLWFNAAKVPIMLGTILWGFIANSILNSNLQNVRNDIAYSGTDYFRSTNVREYCLLGFIFLAIYFIAGGTNKRNSTMFLSSGPYTKKQIKYNELLGLLITLVLFVITYIYIATTFYIRNSQLISIVNGYENIIIIETIKIILFGIIGILFMLIVDMLFANSIIAVLSMILIIPESIMIIIAKIQSILRYFGIGNGESIATQIEYLKYGTKESIYRPNGLLDNITINQITGKRLIFEIGVTIAIAMIMLLLFNRDQRKYKLENGNKIFSSKVNENMIVTLASIGAATLVDFLIIENNFIDNMLYNEGEFIPLVGRNLLKALGCDALCILIIGFIAYRIIKKILKNVG